MTTMTRLAEEAGVSLSTVSHLLNGTRRVSETVRDAVLRAAKEVGYEDPRLARLTRQDKIIGVVVPSVSSPNLAELLEGLGSEAILREVGLMLVSSSEDPYLERRGLERLVERDIDGLVIVPTGGWREHSKPLLRNAGLPLVIVDRVGEELWDHVGTENAQASEALVTHLLTIGHRRIGMIRGLAELPTTIERETGYRQAHARHGVTVDEELIVDGRSTSRGGERAMARLVELSDSPTAVFCSNNAMTAGALGTLHRRNLNVPQDIAVVAFDDLEWSTIIADEITSMAQPFHAIGSRALQVLLARIDDPARPAQTIRMPPSFEHRRSCGCRLVTSETGSASRSS